MNISHTDDNKSLILGNLGFYLYEILGSDYSGIYLSNKEVVDIAQKMGIDVKIGETQKVLGTLIKEAKERGAADTVLSFLADIVTSRISTYEELAKNYEKASDATDEWIIKAKRAKRKLENAITELRNATK